MSGGGKFTVISNASRRGTPPPSAQNPFVTSSTSSYGSNTDYHHAHQHHHYNNNNSSGMEDSEEEEAPTCPLCLEDMDTNDCRFKPCPCGYQICRFCWHRIREEGNEKCPACRRIYTDEDIEFLPETEVMEVSSSKKKKSSAQSGSKKKVASVSTTTSSSTVSSSSNVPIPSGVLPSRRHLVDIRVIQKNLVYVIGISARIANENILKEPEYFGQFGKIIKIVVNRRNTGTPLPAEKISGVATTTSGSAYVTFARPEEAARAIHFTDGSVFDGRILRATYGTTKYCSFFLRDIPCPNAGCMYLHEEGDTDDSYTKEELSSGKMYLHSHLVDPTTDVTVMKTFGTIMYRPTPPQRSASAAAVISPTATNNGVVPTSIIVSANVSGTAAGSAVVANGGGVNAAPNTAQPMQPSQSQSTQPAPQPQQTKAILPEELDQYQSLAQSFFDRISRWNRHCDLDTKTTTDEESTMPDSERRFVPPPVLIDEQHSQQTFDPFGSSAGASNRRHRRIMSAFDEDMSLDLASGPAIAKGPLGGFDWGMRPSSVDALSQTPSTHHNYTNNTANQRERPHPSAMLNGGRESEVFSSARSRASAPLVGPIGSPIGWRGPNSPPHQMPAYYGPGQHSSASAVHPQAPEASFASPSPRVASHPSLERLFGMAGGAPGFPAKASSSSNGATNTPSSSNPPNTTQRIDASQLERQFFREGTGQYISPPPNEVGGMPSKHALPASLSALFAAQNAVPVPSQPSGHPQPVTFGAPNNHQPTTSSTIANQNNQGSQSSQSNKVTFGSHDTTLSTNASGAATSANMATPTVKVTTSKAAATTKSQSNTQSNTQPATQVTPKVSSKTPAPAPVLPPTPVMIIAKRGQAIPTGATPSSSTSSKATTPAKQPTTPQSSAAAKKTSRSNSGATNLFSALSVETTPSSSSESEMETENHAAASAVNVPATEEVKPNTTVVAETKKTVVKGKKDEPSVAASASVPIPLAANVSSAPKLPKRPAFPSLLSQPDYKPVYASAENGYAPFIPPNYSWMSEEERKSIRQYFEADIKAAAAEEKQQREVVNRLLASFKSSLEEMRQGLESSP